MKMCLSSGRSSGCPCHDMPLAQYGTVSNFTYQCPTPPLYLFFLGLFGPPNWPFETPCYLLMSFFL